MKARLLQKSKEVFTGGVIVETVVWELTEATPDRPHGLKNVERLTGVNL